jgi:hypothetical protein
MKAEIPSFRLELCRMMFWSLQSSCGNSTLCIVVYIYRRTFQKQGTVGDKIYETALLCFNHLRHVMYVPVLWRQESVHFCTRCILCNFYNNNLSFP